MQELPLSEQAFFEQTRSLLEGKKVTVCGRSNIVGMPLALLLNKNNATVTLCHSKTHNVSECVKQADIVITAVGKP